MLIILLNPDFFKSSVIGPTKRLPIGLLLASNNTTAFLEEA